MKSHSSKSQLIRARKLPTVRRNPFARLLGATGLTLLLSQSPNAVLISEDDDVYGDDSITLSTDTGFQWLDLTLSTGLSVNQILDGSGDFLDNGFRVATADEVDLFLLEAGWDGVDQSADVDGTVANLAFVELLHGLLGVTGEASVDGGNPGDTFFTEGWALTPDNATTGLLSRPFFTITQNGAAGRLSCTAVSIPVFTTQDFSGCLRDQDAAFSFIGTFLVRVQEGAARFEAIAPMSDEGNASVSIVVQRIGGSADTLTVQAVTADLTATAGVDYTPVNQTLTWLDGDTSTRTVTIDLLDDNEQEGLETFELQLIDGDGGVSRQVISIVDNESRDITALSATLFSPNQASLAGYFDDTCDAINTGGVDAGELNRICNGIRSQATTDAQVSTALDAINPEELAVLANTALRLTTIGHGNLSTRINGLRAGASGIDLSKLTLQVSGTQLDGYILQEGLNAWLGGNAGAADFGRLSFFANGRIVFGDKDASENEAGLDFDTYGITVGADYRLRDNFIVGGGVTYGQVSADFAGGGGADIDSINVALFATYFVEDSFYIDALASVGSNDYDTERRIRYSDALGSIDRSSEGSTDGKQWSASVGSGWDFNRGPWTFGPHIGLNYAQVDVDEMQERGAGGLNLRIGEQDSTSFTANVGAHVSRAFTPSWGVLVPYVRVDTVREFETGENSTDIEFVNDPFIGGGGGGPAAGSIFTIRTDSPDTSFMVWSAGMSAQFVRGFSGFVNYRSIAGSEGLTLNEVSWGMRYEKAF